MPADSLRVVYLSPGAGGMYCGSCLSDNMLARALAPLGCDVTLVPLYTPTLTDEPNVSIDRVFFGGLNVYLQQKVPLLRHLPAAVARLLDSPRLLRMLSRRAVRTDARELGELTLSMVRGEHGHQRREVSRLVEWLKQQPRPDIINLSNLLIAGCVPMLKRELGVPVLVTLQGDDQFLDELTPPYRDETLTALKRLARHVDGFIVHSRFYAAAMADYFDIPAERIHVVPLGIEADVLSLLPIREGLRESGNLNKPPPTVGYLARICQTKGLHILVDAFIRLRAMPGMAKARLHVAGWLGASDEDYFRQQQHHLADSGHADALEFHRAPNWGEKLSFLQEIDVLSVPTTYREPKGRYVLEALAAGVPVVQPRHGAFPEILDRTGGGELVTPNDPAALADALHRLLTDPARRQELGEQGRRGIREHHTAENSARATLGVYQRFVSRTTTAPPS